MSKHVIRHGFHATHHSGARRFSAIKFIVLHDMENASYKAAAENTGSWFRQRASGGSTNFGVDNDSIQQYLGIGTIPWGAPGLNTDGLHIEQMGIASWTKAQWLDRAAGTLDNCAWLIARLNTRLGIPIRTLSDATLRSRRYRGIVTHRQATRVFGGSHTDPGSGYPLPYVLNRAKSYAKKGV